MSSEIPVIAQEKPRLFKSGDRVKVLDPTAPRSDESKFMENWEFVEYVVKNGVAAEDIKGNRIVKVRDTKTGSEITISEDDLVIEKTSKDAESEVFNLPDEFKSYPVEESELDAALDPVTSVIDAMQPGHEKILKEGIEKAVELRILKKVMEGRTVVLKTTPGITWRIDTVDIGHEPTTVHLSRKENGTSMNIIFETMTFTQFEKSLDGIAGLDTTEEFRVDPDKTQKVAE